MGFLSEMVFVFFVTQLLMRLTKSGEINADGLACCPLLGNLVMMVN